MSPDTSFAGLVKGRRVALGMTQANLANLVGRSASAIRSWERGSSTPSDERVLRSIAAVLGIEEGSLRTAVGLAPGRADGDLDEVGEEALAFFVEDGESSTPDGISEPTAPSEQGASNQESPVQVAEISDEEMSEDNSGPTGEEPPTGPLLGQLDRLSVPDDQGSGELSVAESGGGRREAGPAFVPPPVGGLSPSTTSPTTMIPVGETQVQPVEPAYLDDPDQMRTYWVRAALTVAFTIFLLIVLLWAFGRLGDSIGEVWEVFKTGA